MCWQHAAQQAIDLRIITDEVTGPHNSPVDEGGHFIDKGKGHLYVRKADVNHLPLPVFEQVNFTIRRVTRIMLRTKHSTDLSLTEF